MASSKTTLDLSYSSTSTSTFAFSPTLNLHVATFLKIYNLLDKRSQTVCAATCRNWRQVIVNQPTVENFLSETCTLIGCIQAAQRKVKPESRKYFQEVVQFIKDLGYPLSEQESSLRLKEIKTRFSERMLNIKVTDLQSIEFIFNRHSNFIKELFVNALILRRIANAAEFKEVLTIQKLCERAISSIDWVSLLHIVIGNEVKENIDPRSLPEFYSKCNSVSVRSVLDVFFKRDSDKAIQVCASYDNIPVRSFLLYQVVNRIENNLSLSLQVVALISDDTFHFSACKVIVAKNNGANINNELESCDERTKEGLLAHLLLKECEQNAQRRRESLTQMQKLKTPHRDSALTEYVEFLVEKKFSVEAKEVIPLISCTLRRSLACGYYVQGNPTKGSEVLQWFTDDKVRSRFPQCATRSSSGNRDL